MTDENQRDHFSPQKLAANILVNQLAIIRLAERCGKTEELKSDLDNILNYFNQEGIPIGDDDTLTEEEYPELFQEVNDAVASIKYTLDRWSEPRSQT